MTATTEIVEQRAFTPASVLLVKVLELRLRPSVRAWPTLKILRADLQGIHKTQPVLLRE
jgi:hypothetical protein